MHPNLKQLKDELAAINAHNLFSTRDHYTMFSLLTRVKTILSDIPDEPDPLLKLWQVYYKSEDGEDYSMFVRATSAARAFEFWRDYQRVNNRDLDDPGDTITVYAVPEVEGNYGVLEWHTIPYKQVQNGEERS